MPLVFAILLFLGCVLPIHATQGNSCSDDLDCFGDLCCNNICQDASQSCCGDGICTGWDVWFGAENPTNCPVDCAPFACQVERIGAPGPNGGGCFNQCGGRQYFDGYMWQNDYSGGGGFCGSGATTWTTESGTSCSDAGCSNTCQCWIPCGSGSDCATGCCRSGSNTVGNYAFCSDESPDCSCAASTPVGTQCPAANNCNVMCDGTLAAPPPPPVPVPPPPPPPPVPPPLVPPPPVPPPVPPPPVPPPPGPPPPPPVVLPCGDAAHICGVVVTGENAQVLSDVVLELRNDRGVVLMQSKTDASGSYSFPVGAGRYFVSPVADRLWHASPLYDTAVPGDKKDFQIYGVPATISVTDTPGTFILVTRQGLNPVTPPSVDQTSAVITPSFSSAVNMNSKTSVYVPGGLSYELSCWKLVGRSYVKSGPSSQIGVLFPKQTVEKVCP